MWEATAGSEWGIEFTSYYHIFCDTYKSRAVDFSEYIMHGFTAENLESEDSRNLESLYMKKTRGTHANLEKEDGDRKSYTSFEVVQQVQ